MGLASGDVSFSVYFCKIISRAGKRLLIWRDFNGAASQIAERD